MTTLPQSLADAYYSWKQAEAKLYETCDPGMRSDATKGEKRAATIRWNKFVAQCESHGYSQLQVLKALGE
jgi:hypothetical protein